MKSTYIFILIITAALKVHAQHDEGTFEVPKDDSTTTQPAKSLSLSGYIETYYSYDLNQPANNTRPGFVYAYNRHNEVAVNLAYLNANYKADRVHAHLALAAGNYMNANYAAEPGVLKNIYEAYAGVKLSRKHNLWVDAGIMPSHIGFESANGQSCRTLTRSMIADNSPYFESGARLGYTTHNGKWYLAALLLNGWQRIQRVDGNSSVCGGTQVMFMPSDKVTLNSSTFFGNDKPDTISRMRLFHHLHSIVHITRKLDVLFGFDYGIEQQYKGSNTWNNWIGTALQIHCQFTPRIAAAVRGEYYGDRHGIIIATGTPNGFKTSAFSTNFDYTILKQVMWRIEGKLYNSMDAVFPEGNGAYSQDNVVLITSLSVAF